jgi:hypothetical protein
MMYELTSRDGPWPITRSRLRKNATGQEKNALHVKCPLPATCILYKRELQDQGAVKV